MCPSSQYPVLKVHALRLIRSDRAARQGDILPDRRAPGGGNLGVHISYTYKDSRLTDNIRGGLVSETPSFVYL